MRPYAPARLLACLIAAACIVGCGGSKSLPVTGAPPVMDGAKALALVEQQVAIGPRPSGTTAAKMTADFIAQTARDYGYEDVEIDEWEEDTPAGKVTFRNVLVRVGGHGDQFIVLGSHYDTKHIAGAPDFVGANDAASSTATLLEMLRAIKAHGEWRGLPLLVAFFDGEEAVHRYDDNDGLHGSKHLAARLAKEGDISNCRAMVLLDMIGDKDLSITLPPNCDAELKKLVLQIAKEHGAADQFGHYTLGRILDDHEPFRERKVATLNLIDFNYGPGNSYWHTDQDTVDKLSPDSMQTVGNVALDLLWRLR